MTTLLIAEHEHATLKDSTNKALTAATQMGSEVHVLVAGGGEGTKAAAESVKQASADLTGHGVILLVEDEEGLRALNARGLTSRGYTVLEAGNGVEAIEVLAIEY